MTWYSDSSFITSAFGDDVNTPKASAWMRKNIAFPIYVSRLSILENETALRAAVQGGLITFEKMSKAQQRLRQGLIEGILEKKELSPHQWFPQAHRISMHATTGCVCRALDVLHVAAAVILKAKGMLTFDKHQRELAKAEGLEVAP